MEVWKEIPDYQGKYVVSDQGRIANKRLLPKVMKGRADKDGYLVVSLRQPSTSGYTSPRTEKVHRLVALSFVEGYQPDLVVNHKDKDKQNNHVDNLEWVTPQRNTEHGVSVSFKVRDPSGMLVEGTNIAAFCAARGLNSGGFGEMLRGNKPQYRGWKRWQ